MTCQELNAFLDDYLAGALPEQVQIEFQYHLDLCRPCRDYLRTYRETISTARRVYEDPAGEVPDTVPETLVQAVLKARARDRTAPKRDPDS
jgi:predicted anti-sigma-YlaC factor YlaD